MIITGIMAVTKKGIISKKERLPWNYSSEIEYFRKQTFGNRIIMGRKTFETLPELFLKNRDIIVLSKNKNFNTKHKVKIFLSIEDCNHYLNNLNDEKTNYLIGGPEIIEQFIKKNLLSYFLLTVIHQNYEGDKYLNLNLFQKWKKKKIFSCEEYSILYMNKIK